LKVLIVEDERGLSDDIIKYLNVDGNLCESCDNLKEATEKLSSYKYDCVLLDIGLPDGSGLEVLNFLRKNQKNESVIIISAKSSLDDKLNGLNIGADDYLTKPFHLAELKARLMAVYRRKELSGDHTVIFNEISIDIIHRTLTVHEKPILLTRKEFDMLLYFISNKGKVISKDAIAEHLWGEETDMHENFDFIYTHVKNLRKKLLDAGSKDYLKSIYGMGYKFMI
jgi:DNA-binding response OmpR family regulator